MGAPNKYAIKLKTDFTNLLFVFRNQKHKTIHRSKINKNLVRVRFNDPWFVYHDSSWNFQVIFAKLLPNYLAMPWFWKHSYQQFPVSFISLSSKGFLNIIFYGAENNKLKRQGNHPLKYLFFTLIYSDARKVFRNIQHKEI